MLGLSGGFQGCRVYLVGPNHLAVVGRRPRSLQEGLQPWDRVQDRPDLYHCYYLIHLGLALGLHNSLIGRNGASSKP
jgi:hypothetical protein